MAVSSEKTFIFQQFFNQMILVCVLWILTWQEVLTDRSCDICQYTFWLFRLAAIHFLYDILLASYSVQGNDLFFFDNNKQMIRWNSASIHLTILFFLVYLLHHRVCFLCYEYASFFVSTYFFLSFSPFLMLLSIFFQFRMYITNG